MKNFYLFIFILTFFVGCGDSAEGFNNNSDNDFNNNSDSSSDSNPNGYRLIKVVDNRGYTYKYDYNNYGQVVKAITYNYKDEQITQSDYVYNSTNQVSNKTTSNSNTHYKYGYRYNNNGHVINVTKNDLLIRVYKYTYNNGKIATRIYNNTNKDIYAYHEGNIITSTKYTIDDKYLSKNVFTYNDSNQVITDTHYNNKNNINYIYEYAYDNGKIISRTAKTYKLSYFYEDSHCINFLNQNNIYPIFNVFNKSKCKNRRNF